MHQDQLLLNTKLSLWNMLQTMALQLPFTELRLKESGIGDRKSLLYKKLHAE